MKKFCILAFVVVLAVSVMTGCRFGGSMDTTTTTATTEAPTTIAPTTRPTTAPTTLPTTVATEPSTMDILPGTEDTVDPTNGANNTTGGSAY